MHSRRTFLSAGVALPALAAAQSRGTVEEPRQTISQADLVYDKPVERSEEGIPVGNGRMGTLVWTTPSSVRMQINRVDVYANDASSNSFTERHNDYCGGCAFVDIDFGDSGPAPFPSSGFRQHLSVYDGLLTINGEGVELRISASPNEDVIAVAVNNQRRRPVQVDLRMLRFASQYFGQQLEKLASENAAAVRTRSHVATSRLIVQGERIALTQHFNEGTFNCKSAVGIATMGRGAKTRIVNETTVRLSVDPNAPESVILIGSAASFNAAEDVAALAFKHVDAASRKGFSVLRREAAEWWSEFWSQSSLRLASADGSAGFVGSRYHYFLYLMAATSRGKYPPKFNGMLWNTAGDLRAWGAQHWFANLSCYYEAIPATNRPALLRPVFDMYSGMIDACATAARQQWGSEGIYIPETVYFNGLERLPDDVAAEMRDLYLMRKPWDQRSSRFRSYAETKHPHSSRWNWTQSGSWVNGKWVIVERGSGPYGNVNHIFGTTAKVAYWFWKQYEYNMDRTWLRERAYPMLRAAAEFYRNYPNVKKGDDGKYHIHQVNSNESVWGARDTDEDLSAMRGIFPALLRASELLDIDAPMRPLWREFLQNLAPIPTSDHPDALRPAGYNGPKVFVRGLKPAVKPTGFLPDGNSLPMWFFDLCSIECADRDRLQTAQNTFDAYFRNGLKPDTPVGVLSKMAIAAAALGRADAVRILTANQMRVLTRERGTAYQSGGALANRMTLREGPQALDAQFHGRSVEAINLALLQSAPPEPGGDPVLHLFAAWPKDWDADFTLAARGAFLVSGSMISGRIGDVKIVSVAGSKCQLRNPWGTSPVRLTRNGRQAETLNGSLLTFETIINERIRIALSKAPPSGTA